MPVTALFLTIFLAIKSEYTNAMAETARKGKKMPKSKEQHLAELPKKKFKIMNLVWVVIMVLGLFLSVNVTNTHISVLFNNFSQFTDIFVQMCHPDWGYAATAVPLLIETIKMAILGTVIGSAIVNIVKDSLRSFTHLAIINDLTGTNTDYSISKFFSKFNTVKISNNCHTIFFIKHLQVMHNST